jgi:hypothetical protein
MLQPLPQNSIYNTINEQPRRLCLRLIPFQRRSPKTWHLMHKNSTWNLPQRQLTMVTPRDAINVIRRLQVHKEKWKR